MCVHPECTSFFSHIDLAGKKARCKCGNEFIIEPQFHFKRAELRCIKCSNTKQSKSSAAANSIMESILNPEIKPALENAETVLKVPMIENTQMELPVVDESDEFEFGDDAA